MLGLGRGINCKVAGGMFGGDGNFNILVVVWLHMYVHFSKLKMGTVYGMQ